MTALHSVLLLLCSSLILASALPVAPGNQPVALSYQDAEEPGLLEMLEAMKGRDGLDTMMNVLKTYQVVRTTMKGLLALSPLYARVLSQAARHNPELNIILKTLRGESPDIKDLFELSTGRKKSMSISLNSVKNSDPEMVQVYTLLKDPSTLNSAQNLQELLKLLTGKTAHLSQDLLTRMRTGQYTVSSGSLAQANLINVLVFYAENFSELGVESAVLGNASDPSFLLQVMEGLTSLDYSSLAQVKTDKYTLAGGRHTYVTDSDVSAILADRKQGQMLVKTKMPDTNQARQVLLDMLPRLFRVINRVVNAAAL